MKAWEISELLKEQGYRLLDIYRTKNADILRVQNISTGEVFKVRISGFKESVTPDQLLELLKKQRIKLEDDKKAWLERIKKKMKKVRIVGRKEERKKEEKAEEVERKEEEKEAGEES
ncbi:MAG: hypothetical protein ACTSXJ_10085 [Candidatus Baldrarchaeia archaeon]